MGKDEWLAGRFVFGLGAVPEGVHFRQVGLGRVRPCSASRVTPIRAKRRVNFRFAARRAASESFFRWRARLAMTKKM